MPDAQDIPQGVVETAGLRLAKFWHRPFSPYFAHVAELALTAALAEYERLDYRLVRHDEATVEAMAEALCRAEGWQDWPSHAHETAKYRRLARAALTVAQGGECGASLADDESGPYCVLPTGHEGWHESAAQGGKDG